MSDLDIAKVRDILRNWGHYGPWYTDDGLLIGSKFHHIPVDDLTDAEVLAIAGAIAAEGRRKGKA